MHCNIITPIQKLEKTSSVDHFFCAAYDISCFQTYPICLNCSKIFPVRFNISTYGSYEERFQKAVPCEAIHQFSPAPFHLC